MATAPTPTEECPAPPFQDDIEELEKASNQQDQDDAKAKLASLKKINDEVEQTENKYKKEYESLKFRAAQSKAYEASRRIQLVEKVPEPERQRITDIASCYKKFVTRLKVAWLNAIKDLPDLQKDLAVRQRKLAAAEAAYKRALDYQARQKDLDALQTQSGKEIDAQNFRGAYFLVDDIKTTLEEPLPKPDFVDDIEATPEDPVLPPQDFNHYLRKIAKAYFRATDKYRAAKVAFELGTADAQKKKKDYEDAKAKRRENILKQIAEEPFAEPTEDSDTAGTEGEPEL